jgi:hypothetical protein
VKSISPMPLQDQNIAQAIETELPITDRINVVSGDPA